MMECFGECDTCQQSYPPDDNVCPCGGNIYLVECEEGCEYCE